MEERKCCGTFEGTPHRNTCRPNMIKEITRLTALLSERGAEIGQLRVQLAGCGVAAMCNTRESMQEQLVEKGAYGYSASYQDVVDAVNREISLREQLTASQQQVAELQLEVERLKHPLVSACASFENGKKQAARECIEAIEKEHGILGLAFTLRQRYGLEG